MAGELDVLKIVREDVLRILSERKEVQLDNLKGEIRVSYFYILEAIRELEKRGLVYSQQELLKLTEKGKRIAEEILKKHLMIENYFKKTRDEREAHNLANILEHYVSKEVIKNFKLLSTLKEKGDSLVNFGLFRKLLIVDIVIADNDFFERMVSMGIFPGETIKVMSRASNIVVVKIRNKKFALDENLAEKIKAMKL